jgi:hypothetical protein
MDDSNSTVSCKLSRRDLTGTGCPVFDRRETKSSLQRDIRLIQPLIGRVKHLCLPRYLREPSQKMPSNSPLSWKNPALLKLVRLKQPLEPSKQLRDVVQLASLLRRPKNLTVVLQFKGNITVDEMQSKIVAQLVDYLARVRNQRLFDLLGCVLEVAKNKWTVGVCVGKLEDIQSIEIFTQLAFQLPLYLLYAPRTFRDARDALVGFE